MTDPNTKESLEAPADVRLDALEDICRRLAAVASPSPAPDPRLTRLFEYTKFHIPLYTALVGAVFVAAGPRVNFLALAVIVPFGLAGLSGGILLANLVDTKIPTLEEFRSAKIGPTLFGCPLLKATARRWEDLEHASFWFGLVAMVVLLFASGRIVDFRAPATVPASSASAAHELRAHTAQSPPVLSSSVKHPIPHRGPDSARNPPIVAHANPTTAVSAQITSTQTQ